MNDDHLNDMLKACFDPKFVMSERYKAKIKIKLREKQERQNNFLLCSIQIALFLLTFSVITAVSVINQGNIIILLFLACYAVVSGLAGIVVALLCSKNNMITGRV